MRRRGIAPLLPPPPPPPPPPLIDSARWPQESHGWSADQAPRAVPLSYPGRWPEQSVLLTRHGMNPLHLQPGRRLGQARVELGEADIPDEGPAINELPLNYVLARLNAPRTVIRAPVLATGSNAAPSQLRHKFSSGRGASLTIPMVFASVEGLAPGVAAEVSSVGYIPSTPVVGPDYRSDLFVLWLDAHQLATLDTTEPGYRRLLLPAGDPTEGGVRITLPSGEVLGACYCYVSDAGWLVADDGEPLLLGDQRELITRLLGSSRRLRNIMGTTADSWIEQVKQPGKVEAVGQAFLDAGWIRQDPWLDELAIEQDAPYGGGTTLVDSGAALEPTTRKYDHILPATPPQPGTWWVMSSGPSVKRRAQAIVQVAPAIYEELGRPRHVAVQPGYAIGRADMARLDAVARVRVDPSPDTPADRVWLDYVIRDAIGVELGETVRLTPVEVRRRHWPDRIIGPPLYVTARVQAADLVTVEREVCLLSGLTLELLGVRSGDEVVLEGRAGDDGVVGQVRLKAFDTTDAVQLTREREQGGDFNVRYPSARDALGIHPDIPWIFLDKTTRALLGLGGQQLATVRVRASRSFQLRQEVREMLLVLVIALLGLVGLITQPAIQLGIIAAMMGVIGAAIVVRMRGRLSHRVIRSRGRRTRDREVY